MRLETDSDFSSGRYHNYMSCTAQPIGFTPPSQAGYPSNLPAGFPHYGDIQMENKKATRMGRFFAWVQSIWSVTYLRNL